MDFEISEDQRLALDGWSRFIDREIAPLRQSFQDKAMTREMAHALMAKMVPLGVGAGWLPEDGGGMGLDFLTSGLLFEALAYVSPDVAGLAWVAEGAALKVYSNGSPSIKEAYLPGILSGELIGCSAISEPGIGSSVREMRTTAVRSGGGYRLNGEKLWISNATVADFVLVMAKTADQEFSMFLVDREKHGFEVHEIDKLGLNGWPLTQIRFDNVLVSEEYMLGAPGAGLRETMKGFARSRCFVSTLALGIAKAALDASVDYAKQRIQFGKPIAAHQMVQGLLAQMATDFSASQLLVYRALSLMSQGRRCDLEASIAKSFATEAAQRITSSAIQVHGAAGIARDLPLERHFRNARMLTIPDGTTQINQLIIGRYLTGIDAFH